MQWFQNVTNQKATFYIVTIQFDTLHNAVIQFATIQNCTKIIATFYTQKFGLAFFFQVKNISSLVYFQTQL